MAGVNEVLDKVIAIQSERGYSDQQMAEKVGCSRPLYQRTRTGRIPVGGTFLKGAMHLLESEGTGTRSAVVNRKTAETDITLEISIDGTGKYEIDTEVPFFDHMLAQLARHGLFDIRIKATGDDQHHIVEDVAMCLGKAFGEALGEKRGIARMASMSVPMDEALSTVAIDISGRGYTVLKLDFSGNDMRDFAVDLVRHFLESFAFEARINLHARTDYGTNDHHKAEALFKALARALDTATRLDPRKGSELPSTKDYLES